MFSSSAGLLTFPVFVQLSNSVDHYISNFKIVDNLTDRGSLIIHLFKVKHDSRSHIYYKTEV